MLKRKSREITTAGRVIIGTGVFIFSSLIISAVITQALYSGKISEADIPATAAANIFLSALLGTVSATVGKGEGRRRALITAGVIILIRVITAVIGGGIAATFNPYGIAAAAAGCAVGAAAAFRRKKVKRRRNWSK